MPTALILSGGGARGAYQVGVLKAVAEILPKDTYNPFPIICGTSTGGINALALAGRAGFFRLRMRKLEYIWRSISPDKVYRSDAIGVLKNTAKVMMSFIHSGYSFGSPVALFDNTPLRELLEKTVRFRHIDEAIASGELLALCITCMSYTTGQSVAFFQGSSHHQPWERSRRVGVRSGLTVEHLMASSAIPALFPAVKIGDHFYGDGAIRQLKPLSSALQLGAKRLFVVGVSDNPRHKPPMTKPDHPPSTAQIISHMFNSAFIDAMEADLETLRSINQLVADCEEQKENGQYPNHRKYIDALSVTPSQPIDAIAAEYLGNLPTSLKLFMRAIGATAQGGGASTASFLLFEKEFCTRLLNMGYRDALEQEKEIREFFKA